MVRDFYLSPFGFPFVDRVLLVNDDKRIRVKMRQLAEKWAEEQEKEGF